MAPANALPDLDRPFRRASARSAVVDYVRRLIFDGALVEGDRIPQQQVAAKLGLSRIPVREGLVALEREGVVTIEPHRGAFVSRFDERAIDDQYELYGLIYGHAARCAAERANEEDLDAVRAARTAVDDARDAEQLLEAATGFRDTLVRIGGSPCFHGTMRSLSGVVPGNVFDEIPGAVAVAKKGFRLIAAAIEQRDGEAAAAHCTDMMRAQARNVNRARSAALAPTGDA